MSARCAMSVYMCKAIHLRIHLCIYTAIQLFGCHTCIDLTICSYRYARIHIGDQTYIRISVHSCNFTPTHGYIDTYVHIHIGIRIFIETHMHS